MVARYCGVLLLALMVGLTSVAARAGACQLVEKASLPADFSHNRIVMEITVDGTPVKMILDTGASYSALGMGLAQRLKLQVRELNARFYGVGGETNNMGARIGELLIGRLRSQNLVVLAVNGLGDGTDGAPAGLLGYDLFGGYDLELDPAGGRVRWFSSDHCPGRVVYWNSSHFEVPFSLGIAQGKIGIPGVLDGQSLSAVIDTGSRSEFLDLGTARRVFGIDPSMAAPGEKARTTDVEGKALPEIRHRFARLEIGPITLPNRDVWLTPFGKAEAVLGSRIHEAVLDPLIIGMDVISKLHSFISYSEKKLYFTLANERDLAPAAPASP